MPLAEVNDGCATGFAWVAASVSTLKPTSPCVAVTCERLAALAITCPGSVTRCLLAGDAIVRRHRRGYRHSSVDEVIEGLSTASSQRRLHVVATMCLGVVSVSC